MIQGRAEPPPLSLSSPEAAAADVESSELESLSALVLSLFSSAFLSFLSPDESSESFEVPPVEVLSSPVSMLVPEPESSEPEPPVLPPLSLSLVWVPPLPLLLPLLLFDGFGGGGSSV